MIDFDLIDIHNHILPNIDDGAIDIMQSIEMLKEAENVGFKKIVTSSHYFEPNYVADSLKRKELIDELKQHTNIVLMNGCELYFNLEYDSYKQKAPRLNNSKYMLIEFPLNAKPSNYMDFIYLLLENNIVPIIAHPERYRFVEDITFYQDLKNTGCLFQLNIGSFAGFYGKKEKLKAKFLMKNKVVDFLATDCHRPNSIYPYVPKIVNNLIEDYGKEYIKELFSKNPSKVIRNEDIQTNEKLNDFSFFEKALLKR